MCDRCEHRVRAGEMGHAPRWECSQSEGACLREALKHLCMMSMKWTSTARMRSCLRAIVDGVKGFSSSSCYMYCPVKPVALKRNTRDPRPAFTGWALSARLHPVGLPSINDFVRLTTRGRKGELIPIWLPWELFLLARRQARLKKPTKRRRK